VIILEVVMAMLFAIVGVLAVLGVAAFLLATYGWFGMEIDKAKANRYLAGKLEQQQRERV
jgi:hypothetical protein